MLEINKMAHKLKKQENRVWWNILIVLILILPLIFVIDIKNPDDKKLEVDYYLKVINGDSFDLKKGDLVYIYYANNSNFVVKVENNSKIYGIVENNIASKDYGYINMVGIVKNINTSYLEEE